KEVRKAIVGKLIQARCSSVLSPTFALRKREGESDGPQLYGGKYGNNGSAFFRAGVLGSLRACSGAHGARGTRRSGDLRKEQLLVFLRSHQLSVGSHPTPADLLSAKGGKANLVGLWQRQSQSQGITVARRRAGL